MSQIQIEKDRKPGHGAVAVVVEEQKFLVIRRSEHVRAPNLLCFAGGTIEKGESPEEAIVRELEEELAMRADPVGHIWQSRTAWGTLLEWILVTRHCNSSPKANPAEVSEFMWLAAEDLLQRPDLLPSVPDFFIAWAAGAIQLPTRAGKPDRAWVDMAR